MHCPNLPIDLLIYTFKFLGVDIRTVEDLRYLNFCSVCDQLSICKNWYCSDQCESQALLMLG
jgi:hypothetical protein